MLRVSTTSSSATISTATSIRTQRLATGSTEDRGLIDTSVAVEVRKFDSSRFPTEMTISTLTLAELIVGPQAATDDLMRARRERHLRFIEANLETLCFDQALNSKDLLGLEGLIEIVDLGA